ncbi:putative spermidine/putrescine transport system substrate-binding protein [Mesorhizobium robiniae]|uniref:Spermidine/putrescine transport system substrate-binding protein n=1 Tax=Mesorhizobium robiniae TaxID=559315 RepID=A0ABV2GKX3_9HYPH
MPKFRTAFLSLFTALGCLSAQAEEVVFACWGGASQQNFQTNILPGFEKQYGATVRYVPGGSTYFVSQLQAQKAAPEIDVACMDDGPQSIARELGLLEPLTAAQVPAIPDILPAAIGKDNSGVGYGMLAMGLVYSPEALSAAGIEPPTSWNDLADPRFKGHVVLGTIDNTPGLFALMMLARTNGGGIDNMEPGFAKMKEVAANVGSFVKGTDMTPYFQQGEAWITVWTNSEMNRFVSSSGFPLEFVFPKEGAPAVMPMLNLVKNAPNSKMGANLIAYLLSPETQKQFALSSKLGPVNTKVTLSEDEAKGLIYGKAADSLINLDWSAMNAKRPEWTKRWNEEIER